MYLLFVARGKSERSKQTVSAGRIIFAENNQKIAEWPRSRTTILRSLATDVSLSQDFCFGGAVIVKRDRSVRRLVRWRSRSRDLPRALAVTARRSGSACAGRWCSGRTNEQGSSKMASSWSCGVCRRITWCVCGVGGKVTSGPGRSRQHAPKTDLRSLASVMFLDCDAHGAAAVPDIDADLIARV